MTLTRTAIAALSGVTLALSMAACTGGSATDADAVTAGSNRPAATESAEPVAETSTTTPAPAPATNPKFGEAFTWEDGIAVTIGAPTPFTPDEFAIELAGGESAAYLAFEVTVVNGSSANFDPSMFTTTLQSANVEAEEIFDSGNGFGGSPSTTLLPGREAKFKIGYGVTDPADLVLEVSPSFEHEDAIFTS